LLGHRCRHRSQKHVGSGSSVRILVEVMPLLNPREAN
jgi:hypothetical protein